MTLPLHFRRRPRMSASPQPPRPMLRLRTFGKSVIEIGTERILPTHERAFALVLLLAADRRRHSRSVVQEMLFGDQMEPKGSHSLRQLVYKLRQRGLAVESTPSDLGIVDA